MLSNTLHSTAICFEGIHHGPPGCHGPSLPPSRQIQQRTTRRQTQMGCRAGPRVVFDALHDAGTNWTQIDVTQRVDGVGRIHGARVEAPRPQSTVAVVTAVEVPSVVCVYLLHGLAQASFAI